MEGVDRVGSWNCSADLVKEQIRRDPLRIIKDLRVPCSFITLDKTSKHLIWLDT